MITRFYVWVTSDCNLSCPHCSQKYTMIQNEGYEMSCEEVSYIVGSCLNRGIRFDTIEITGGEPTLWKNIDYGVKRFREIAGEVTLVTNGNNPYIVKSFGFKRWIVSASQATQEQLDEYKDMPQVVYNYHDHKPMPTTPFDNVLPASCCVAVSPVDNLPQNAMEYIRGKVYYCCDAFAHSEHTGITDDIVCNFWDDFMTKFSNKAYDKDICRYCLCNGKIWNQV